MSRFQSIRSINRLLLQNTISQADILESSQLRAKEIAHLNAFNITCDPSPPGYTTNDDNLLVGIPYALKDNYSSKDIMTTCASRMLESYIAPYNSTVLDRLETMGALLIGKTNMDEFAMGSGSIDSIFEPVKNPWTPGILERNPRLTDWNIAGGSSGGSAVAVATGVCSFAIGSDTGGSVRNPASFCGIVGFKPTYGVISRHGLIPLVNSMDCPSIFARTVDDVAIVLDALAGRDDQDSTSVSKQWEQLQSLDLKSLDGYRVGIPKECLVNGMTSDVIDTWKWAADEFANAGAEVVEVNLPHMRYSIVCYHILCAAEVASNMARFDGLKYGHRCDMNESSDAMMAVSRKEGLNDTVRSRVLAGNYFLLKENREKYFEKAQRVRRLISDDYKAVFGASLFDKKRESDAERYCDVLLSPAVLSDAPLYSEFVKQDNRTRSAEQDVLTQSANLAGIPAVVVPTKLSSNNLPIGLQISGNHFSEPKILKIASFLEKIANFPNLKSHTSK